MKRLLLFVLSISLFSCELDDNGNPNSSELSAAQLTEELTLSSGLRLVQFIEDGEDYTSEFSGFVFRFEPNGTVTASRGSQSITGTYRVFRDDGETELEMTFSPTSFLNEFTDDWYFRGKSNNRITFEDDDDEDGLSRLVFEK